MDNCSLDSLLLLLLPAWFRVDEPLSTLDVEDVAAVDEAEFELRRLALDPVSNCPLELIFIKFSFNKLESHSEANG